MSVRDERLPPFAWIALEDLDRIAREVPTNRQAAARNALLGLAEAASRRREGTSRGQRGDTLRVLATLCGVSERRLRDTLQELARVGLVRIEQATDERGADLPTTYVLTGSDRSSDRADISSDPPDAPSDRADRSLTKRPTLRARGRGKEEEETSVYSPGSRATEDERPTTDDDEEEALAEHVRGILQRGIDGLTTIERTRPPTTRAVLEALREHPLPRQDAIEVAIAVRSIAQAQNRAPNIAGLYAQRLAERSAEIAAPAARSPSAPPPPPHRMTGIGHPRPEEAIA